MSSTTIDPPMLAIGPRSFAPSATALVDSLFNPNGTADGIYSIRARGVLFKRPNGEPFAFLVANPGQTQFFVSCAYAPRTGGKPTLHYFHGLTDAHAQNLGVFGMSYSKQSDEASRIWDMFRPTLNTPTERRAEG